MQLEVEYETSQAINMTCSNLLDYNGAPEVLTEELQLHLNSFAHETEREFGSLAVCQDCPVECQSCGEAADFCNMERALCSQEHSEKKQIKAMEARRNSKQEAK